MTEVRIREAEPCEYPLVDRLAVQAWQILRPGYDPEQFEGLLEAISRTSKLSEMGRLLVALIGVESGKEEVAGAVAYMPPGCSNSKIFEEGWPSMRMLVVHPDHRGKGIGRALAEECVEMARKDGAEFFGLHTSPVMSVALPLYLRMGFEKDRNLEPIAGAPYERYRLRL